MGKNEQELVGPSPTDSLPEISFHNRDKVLRNIKVIKNGFDRIRILLAEYKSSNDMNKQESLKARIAINIETITGEISHVVKTIGIMQLGTEDKRRAIGDLNFVNVRVRILSTTVSALQQKLLLLVKEFNTIQIYVKESYRDKVSSQLRAFDPKIADEIVIEMVNDPTVFSSENAGIYQSKSIQIDWSSCQRHAGHRREGARDKGSR